MLSDSLFHNKYQSTTDTPSPDVILSRSSATSMAAHVALSKFGELFLEYPIFTPQINLTAALCVLPKGQNCLFGAEQNAESYSKN